MQHTESVHKIRVILHDLAQPLAAMAGLVDLLLVQMDERDSYFQEVQLISLQLEKALAILSEIHRVAREATGAALPAPEPQQAH